MTIVADPVHREGGAPYAKGAARKRVAHKLRILAAVSNTESTRRVLDCLLELHALRATLEVVLLSVQPEPNGWRLRGYGWCKRDEIHDRLINDVGRPAVHSAGQQLDAAGIVHKDRVELGAVADTILRCAREEECDLIVLAEAGPGPISRSLLRSAGVSIGSVASTVIGFARVPVIVAK